MENKAVFIDRDGTINVNVGYIDHPDDFQMYPGVIEGIKLLKKNGYKIIIVTNQSGIGRGYFVKKNLDDIHHKMNHELSENGTTVDAIYYCPHHPDDQCNCRKPKTGLLEQAVKDLNIDIKESFIIGDRMLDMEAGDKIGCNTVLVPENKEKVSLEMKKSLVKPDCICDDFLSGVQWILNHENSLKEDEHVR